MLDQDQQDPKNTPLYNKHLSIHARMVPFSGWNMPVQYTGIIEEHLHTRAGAGLFDICHMGEFLLKGASAEKDIDHLMTCRIDDIPVGRCRYGFLLNEKGGVIDDLIVFKISDEEFMLVVNAGTIAKDRTWIEKNISSGTDFDDISDQTAKLDVQGPASGRVMEQLVGKEFVEGIKRYYFDHTEIGGVKTLISRTGYTGELGYELFFGAEHADKFWDILLGIAGVKPIGLGARDTLRLEMGYSLYGHDLSEVHNPFEANLSRFVYMDKDFIGKEALLDFRDRGITRQLIGFLCEGRRSAREHYDVLSGDRKTGIVTSGGFSPCLKKGMGLCYIDKELAVEGGEIKLSDGKVEISATLKNIPIYKKL